MAGIETQQQKREYVKQYREAHREEQKEKRKIYRAAHKEKLRVKAKEYYDAHAEQFREKARIRARTLYVPRAARDVWRARDE